MTNQVEMPPLGVGTPTWKSVEAQTPWGKPRDMPSPYFSYGGWFARPDYHLAMMDIRLALERGGTV